MYLIIHSHSFLLLCFIQINSEDWVFTIFHRVHCNFIPLHSISWEWFNLSWLVFLGLLKQSRDFLLSPCVVSSCGCWQATQHDEPHPDFIGDKAQRISAKQAYHFLHLSSKSKKIVHILNCALKSMNSFSSKFYLSKEKNNLYKEVSFLQSQVAVTHQMWERSFWWKIEKKTRSNHK